VKITKRLAKKIKRVCDFFLSLFLFLITLPLFPVIAILIKLDSPGSLFYRWEVVGKDGEPFVGYKFRTMYEEAEQDREDLENENEMEGPVFKMEDDPRVTPVGKHLRSFSLDELPQLWSVLKGDMSLVGPRPPLREEYREFEDWQKKKLAVKPGMACLREVRQLEEGERITDFDEWVELDLEYIENWSLWLDLKIMLKTIVYIVKGGNV